VKLACVEIDGQPRVALVLGNEFVDLSEGSGIIDAPQFLMMRAARQWAEAAAKSATERLPMDGARLRVPVQRADKIIGVGMNYHSFVAAAREIDIPVPAERLWFMRPRGCLVGPYDEVWLPANSHDLDYEAELAVVIGCRCRHVTAAEAARVIAGFTVANDLTLRQRAFKSPILGKSFDTHTPLGPWIVTPDEIAPHNLAVRTWVNGQLRQESNTADMIANCYDLIAEISTACTLNPGDILLTGTPAGCGAFQRPPATLAAGDVVKIEIECIGFIENRVVDEPTVQMHQRRSF
jgi:2-keto-4-pentenoate hydratase/2-oxohepta-3-ene-1,7-dioic acid hydratase in catechol pathway